MSGQHCFPVAHPDQESAQYWHDLYQSDPFRAERERVVRALRCFNKETAVRIAQAPPENRIQIAESRTRQMIQLIDHLIENPGPLFNPGTADIPTRATHTEELYRVAGEVFRACPTGAAFL